VRGTVHYGVVIWMPPMPTASIRSMAPRRAARALLLGKFVFVNGGLKDGLGTAKGFAYLLDYDKTGFINAAARGQLDSSQTYGFGWWARRRSWQGAVRPDRQLCHAEQLRQQCPPL
jgi:hypothetical protein